MNKLLKTENEDYVIASDTDSIYLRLVDLIDKVSANKDSNKIIQFMIKFVKIKYNLLLTKVIMNLLRMSMRIPKMQMKW